MIEVQVTSKDSTAQTASITSNDWEVQPAARKTFSFGLSRSRIRESQAKLSL